VPVSDSDLAHVRRAFAEFNERYESIREDGIDDFFREFYAPDAVIENVDNFPAPGTYSGLDGYREWFRESYRDYRDVTWRDVQLERAGECVLVVGRIWGTNPEDGVELEIALGITYEMRDGRIGHVRVYLGHERARDAASSGG
jgi:ketosteroid isomerase-like protein